MELLFNRCKAEQIIHFILQAQFEIKSQELQFSIKYLHHIRVHKSSDDYLKCNRGVWRHNAVLSEK